ncbi:MAG TPA: beta-ketoacyl synthase N-terminal-like domain-containing protein, partial [Candidatus Xenobia bacterium]
MVEAATILEALDRRVQQTPNELAFVWLDDQDGGARFTWAELDQRARSVASHLASHAAPGERALLLYPSGLEFLPAFFGCLYAQVVAVPLPLPRPSQVSRRLQGVVGDAQPVAVLTSRQALPRVERIRELQDLRIVATDDVTEPATCSFQPPAADRLAYLQYTSGSISSPRGVMVTHLNLASNLRMLQAAWQHPAGQFLVSWLPLFHDMGLVTKPLLATWVGAPCALMAPTAFLTRPIRWLRAISQYRAHTSGAPNFGYDLCLRKTTPSDRAELDLSTWRVAFNGAEPVQPQTLERIAEAFEPNGFRRDALQPVYGLAEATVFVTGNSVGQPLQTMSVDAAALAQHRVEPGTRRVPACGRAWGDERLRIVRPDTLAPCSPQEVGEIWVAGSHVAPGYWTHPSVETFGAQVAGDGPFLRTGDLGFMLESGQLFVTGRLKDLIVIRGVNHYPQDIELTVQQSHPALRAGDGTAFSVERDGEEHLVVVHEMSRLDVPLEEVTVAVRHAVSEGHDLEVLAVVFIKKGTLPKTSSGKVQRLVCKDDFLAKRLQEVVPWLGRRRLSRSPASPTGAPPGVADLLTWVRRHEQELLASRHESPGQVPVDLLQALGAMGFLRMAAASEQGGLGLSLAEVLPVLEQLGAIDPSLALLVGQHNFLGVQPLARHGSPAARQEHLPDLLSGQLLGGFAMVESGTAASHPAGGWRLVGSKPIVSPSGGLGVIHVLVQGSVFSLAGGVRHGSDLVSLGLRGLGRGTVHLDDVAVGDENVVGVVGEGLSVAREAMHGQRLTVAAVCLGGMKRCMQLFERHVEPWVLDNPQTLVRLTEITSGITALEAMIEAVTRRLAQGVLPPEEVFSACSMVGAELFGQAADAFRNQLGTRSFGLDDEPVLKDARFVRFFDSPADDPSDSLLDYLPSALAERWRRAVADLEARSTARNWVRERAAELATTSVVLAALEEAGPDAETARAWARERFDRQLDSALRGAAADAILRQADAVRGQIKRYGEAVGELSHRAKPPSHSAPQIQAWLAQWLMDRKQLAVEPGRPLAECGLDSLQAVELARDVGAWLRVPVDATALWSFPTVEALSQHLAGQTVASSPLTTSVTETEEPIAIIGIGCRLPGGVDGPDAYWRLLHDSVDAITEVPAERFDVDAYYDPTPGAPGKTVSRWGGFLHDVDRFDAAFFGIAPREATSMDPQQRLLLEVSWEALEHAGQAPDTLSGSPTGVFVGICGNDYAALARPGGDNWSGTGNAYSVAAGRVSYVLGLQGPSIIVDTASSSSLVAVHLACQSLRTKECALALAGGVNLILTPDNTLYMSQLGTLSPDGRCKPFDASANGYVRSEGCGMVVLKRLADAEADGDRVLAVIRASAVNQDGRSNGLTAPSGPAQAVLIRRALLRAGVHPADVSYHEAHGTGTPLGDQVEVQALGRVLREGRP